MTRRKIVLIVTAAIIAVIVALAALLVTNLDRMIKSAIEQYGSEATGTAVRVGSVKIELTRGKGSIRRLIVANPPGFTAPHLFSLNAISVIVDPRTAASDVVVIDEVRLAGPQVIYERNEAGQSNVDVIRKNLDSAIPSGSAEEGNAKGKKRKLRIRKLVIENGTVEVRVAGLGGRPRTAALPRVEMHDIGGAAGAAPEQVARQVMTRVLSEAAGQAAEAGAEKLLEKGLDRLIRKMQDK